MDRYSQSRSETTEEVERRGRLQRLEPNGMICGEEEQREQQRLALYNRKWRLTAHFHNTYENKCMELQFASQHIRYWVL